MLSEAAIQDLGRLTHTNTMNTNVTDLGQQLEMLKQGVTIDPSISSNETGQDESYEPLPGQMIYPSEDPTQDTWAIFPLYITDNTGKLRVWQAGYDAATDEIITKGGLIGPGYKHNILSRRVVGENSIRSGQEKALQDVRKLVLDMTRKGYQFGSNLNSNHLPVQLANVFHFPNDKDPLSGKKLSCQIKEHDFPVWVQDKMDGHRSISRYRDNHIVFTSRVGLNQPWLDHIRLEYEVFFSYLPPGIGIDGELYCHDMTLQQIQSAVTTHNKKLPGNEKLSHYIIDLVIPDKTLEERHTILTNAYKSYLGDGNKNTTFFLSPHRIANSYQDLKDYHHDSVERGFEGIVIRWPAGPNPTEKRKKLSCYRGDKNNNLLKYKCFIDEEGTIIEVKEALGNDRGTAVFRIKDSQGIEFDCRPRGSRELRAKYFQQPDNCLGRQYTFRYFNRSPTNVPIFPTGVRFRDIVD